MHPAARDEVADEEIGMEWAKKWMICLEIQGEGLSSQFIGDGDFSPVFKDRTLESMIVGA